MYNFHFTTLKYWQANTIQRILYAVKQNMKNNNETGNEETKTRSKTKKKKKKKKTQ